MAYTPKKITELFAWICIEPDGGDGIPAIDGGGGLALPMVGSDRERMEALRPWALACRHAKGYPVRLVRFSSAEELEKL